MSWVKIAILAIERIGWSPDVIHCNDWQSTFLDQRNLNGTPALKRTLAE